MGDLKPAPVLWHEDSGRKPFDNGRYNNNPSGAISGRQIGGAISGRQLGEAAHRLVVNSLQSRGDKNNQAGQIYPPHIPHPVGYGPRHQPYQNHAYPGGERAVMQASSGYSHHRPTSSIPYRQPYAPPPHNNPPYNNRFQNPRDELNDRSVPYVRDHPRHGYYAQGPPQRGGHGYAPYPPGNVGQAPIRPGVYYHNQPTGYNISDDDRSYGGSYNHKGSSWAPPVNTNAGRGYNHPRQPGNQYSALGRGGGRRPPQSDHHRRLEFDTSWSYMRPPWWTPDFL
ncbi:hypothetical protein DH2020_027440 [Rehmannia glutinosa]|uniref:Uncharacterized protein n=1 Tax=Rehmannia glutinosa TaxID=99300 RepID=A0ABR0VVY9_REHGL